MCFRLGSGMTPSVATSSTVSMPWRGGTTQTTSAGLRFVPLSMAATRWGVGGTMGSDSDHLRPANRSFTSASVPVNLNRLAG